MCAQLIHYFVYFVIKEEPGNFVIKEEPGNIQHVCSLKPFIQLAQPYWIKWSRKNIRNASKLENSNLDPS